MQISSACRTPVNTGTPGSPLTSSGRIYQVFARHGDIYDPFNYEGDRDASSLGDAIVVDLVNRFPMAAEKVVGARTGGALISELRDIDSVRPLIDIPPWIQSSCCRTKSPDAAQMVKDVWNTLVDRFLELPFVKKHDTLWPLDLIDKLQLCLKISTGVSLETISCLRRIFGSPLHTLVCSRTDYVSKAFSEVPLRTNLARFVVYGHTHAHEIVPLDVTSEPDLLEKTYFNTGTWRCVHERAALEKGNPEFLTRHVMTFVAFYLKDERKGHDFEVWNGALGRAPVNRERA